MYGINAKVFFSLSKCIRNMNRLRMPVKKQWSLTINYYFLYLGRFGELVKEAVDQLELWAASLHTGRYKEASLYLYKNKE